MKINKQIKKWKKKTRRDDDDNHLEKVQNERPHWHEEEEN